jgi:DNA-binding IclR family transcriptional regulator
VRTPTKTPSVREPAGQRGTDPAARARAGRSRATVAIDQPHFGTANSTADRAIDILLLFSDDKPFWTANEIAARFGMPKSTVYRYVNSLRSYALIDEDGEGGFRLGPRIFPLARTARASTSVVRIVRPHLQAVADTFGELMVLQQRVGYEILSLDRIQTQQRVSIASTRSHLLPWPGTSSAKLLLAYAPPGEQAELMRLLHPTVYTPRTVRSKAALRVQLERVVHDGYAVTDEERDEGVWGVAAPVFERGRAVYAIGLAAPKFRMTSEKAPGAIEAVKAAAAAATRDLAMVDI